MLIYFILIFIDNYKKHVLLNYENINVGR